MSPDGENVYLMVRNSEPEEINQIEEEKEENFRNSPTE